MHRSWLVLIFCALVVAFWGCSKTERPGTSKINLEQVEPELQVLEEEDCGTFGLPMESVVLPLTAEHAEIFADVMSGECGKYEEFKALFGAKSHPNQTPFNGDEALLEQFLLKRYEKNIPECFDDLGAFSVSGVLDSVQGCHVSDPMPGLVKMELQTDPGDVEGLVRLSDSYAYHTLNVNSDGYPLKFFRDLDINPSDEIRDGTGMHRDFSEGWYRNSVIRIRMHAMSIDPLRTAYALIRHNVPSDCGEIWPALGPLEQMAQRSGRAALAMAALYYGGFWVRQDTIKARDYLTLAFAHHHPELLAAELSYIARALSVPKRNARGMINENTVDLRRETLKQFLEDWKSLVKVHQIMDPQMLGEMAVARFDAGFRDDGKFMAYVASALLGMTYEKCVRVEKIGASDPPVTCSDRYLHDLLSRTEWRSIELQLLSGTNPSSESLMSLLTSAMDHDPTGYHASEFVLDLLSNREFLDIAQARKIAMNVVARDTTGTSAWMLVKASWLAPKQVRISDEEQLGYLKLAADRSLINQYGEYAIEYGLLLMGVPRPYPEINTYAVRPYAYDHYAYDRNGLYCNPWIDTYCLYSDYSEPRPQRPLDWNPLWSLYRQMGDFNWMLYVDCIDNMSYQTGEDGCAWDSDGVLDGTVCHQNMLSIGKKDYQLGMKYLNHAVDLIKRGQPATYFKKMDPYLPVVPQKNNFERADQWQNEVINHLQYRIDSLDKYKASAARPYLVEILKSAMIKPYR